MEVQSLMEQLVDCFKTFKDSKVICASKDGELIVPQSEKEALELVKAGYTAYFRQDLKKELGTEDLFY
ncbi:hypothetical protein KMW28_16055 [Flammeovirga yaeyamensis]|uniref:Uncharacterized protein n=1 Tax=Flammeovirga yaeyamensis TaxID=367791 RepID=A0AAX1N0X6_9BACT|nr:hypothetical protein [Flammeovirga yaeyamensis]MBB3698477.1 hypothetical protein [Flammeovirga yaeyamensis]NMF34174.1 hypothetical protein [Flammeovirga yaeyamensis]QWG01159.1 hypothetical protein KMW28_16055 [Flammeovirga yaeyamensis]